MRFEIIARARAAGLAGLGAVTLAACSTTTPLPPAHADEALQDHSCGAPAAARPAGPAS